MRGFSLVELLVVVGIFVVITGVVLSNHTRFNSSVLLGNAAYDIALSVREAQVFGLSTRGTAGVFEVGYGVHFATPTSYLLFSDGDRNNRYDSESGTDTVIKTFSLQRGYEVLRYCGVRTNGTEDCSDNGAALPHLDIAFLRPNPDAAITSASGILYSSAKVTLRSGSGETRTVSVQSTGQIAVSNP